MDDVAPAKLRSDPFGLGLAAHRAALARAACPFPAPHVEARRWLAGWDHAETGPAPRAAQRERRWSRGEEVVLSTLVRSGEALSSLASRLGRTKVAIRDQCVLQQLVMTEAQERS